MGNVVLLDDLTINKIAAGEVIERPQSVVKELVENSIDAGATKITVEIKNGGKSLIKIIDNGKGIEEEDLIIALERHATSKIKKVEDLEKIYTMGFRGEALASIVAISKLTIISKTVNEDSGKKLIAEAGDVLSISETACQVGTTMIVENLFFNTPVRYKFLKNDATEFKYIKDLVQRIALANPNVSITLISDGKKCFSSTGSGNIKDVIYSLYGKEIRENLIDVNYEEDNIKITGVIGNTRIAKDSRKDQFFFLNKRYIKNPALTSSSDQAFKGSTGIGKHGFFILNIEMPADGYDVNVHPNKMEVRFKNETKIYQVVYRAIKNAVLNEGFLGNNEISNEEKRNDYIENEFKFVTNYYGNDSGIKKIYVNSSSDEANIIKRDEKRNVEYKYIGIIFKTYIIIEIENEIYLIDQHAAHERYLYEQIKNNYKNNIQGNSQMTLIPEVINLTHKELEFVKNNISLFQKVGYDIDFFGNNEIKINGVPDIEYKSKTTTKDMFMDILDEVITNSRSNIKDIEERFIATVACKAAVKAHMVLTREEAEILIQNLLSLQNPYTCPHGRPTTIKINKDELIKKM